MRDLFIADAHLLDPADESYRRLLAFLAAEVGRVRTLYLLGDIFEFWVGYRHVVFTPYVPLLEALWRLREAGTDIVFVEGNHDFHLGPFFRETLGCRVLPEGGAVEIDGRRVFLAHGDQVDSTDRGYRLLRAFLRSRFMRLVMGLAPPDLTWAVARWAGRRSRGARVDAPPRRAPRQLLERFAAGRFAEGFGAVVTGHYHDPLLLEKDGATLLALGDWMERRSYAVYENGRFRLETAAGAPD